jgi:hypothetical protein
MVDYNIAIPQQQLFQAPDVMQNAMRMQQMQTQDASAQSANQLRAMQTRGLEQGQQLTAIQIQAAKQNMLTAAAAARAQAAARAEALSDKNALANAYNRSAVGFGGPQLPSYATAAENLAAEGKFGPAASMLGVVNAFTESEKKKVDLSKTRADLAKVNTEALDKQLQVFRTISSNVYEPKDAGVHIAAMIEDPLIGPLMLRMGTREELIAKAQNDFARLGRAGWYAANSNLTSQQVMDTLTKKYETTDLGGEVSTQAYLLGEPVGAPVVQAKTMTPKEAASIETPEQKLAYQAALKRQTAQIDKETAGVETSKQLTTAIKELEDAAKPGGLIEQSTGSGFGTGVDATAGFFGIGTSGARAIGQLQPIADLVLKMVPRFEGPQSNADVESYNRAAGQIADPKVPNSIRIDAAKTLIRLMKERKDQFVMQSDAGAAQPKTFKWGDLK